MGRKHTDQSKAKMSATRLGLPLTEKQRKNLASMIHGNTGRSLSHATRMKISLANAGRKKPDGFAEAMRQRMLGGKLTEEHKKKISAGMLNRGLKGTDAAKKQTEAARLKTKGSKLSEEHKLKIGLSSASRSYGPPSIQTRMKIAAAHRGKKMNLTDEQIARMVGPAHAASRRVRVSSIEKSVCERLRLMGVEHETQVRIGRFFADILVPAKSLVIECDGEYWHRHTAERDSKRDAYMESRGFFVLRLQEKTIRSGEMVGLREALGL